MKTIILYATKYGAAKEIAERLSGKMGKAEVRDIKQAGGIEDFDCVIIGTSVYAGRIRPEAKAFVLKNAAILKAKKLGIFLSGIGASGEKDYLKNNFAPDILQSAKAAKFLGGIFDPKKAGAIERLIIRIITKKSSMINAIDDEKINAFVTAMNL